MPSPRATPVRLMGGGTREAITARRAGGGARNMAKRGAGTPDLGEKQRALIFLDTGEFNHAAAGLRAELAEHPLTKGVMSSD
jgi:hypothetical protein